MIEKRWTMLSAVAQIFINKAHRESTPADITAGRPYKDFNDSVQVHVTVKMEPKNENAVINLLTRAVNEYIMQKSTDEEIQHLNL